MLVITSVEAFTFLTLCLTMVLIPADGFLALLAILILLKRIFNS